MRTLSRVLSRAVMLCKCPVHRSCTPRVRSDDERPGIPGGGGGSGKRTLAPYGGGVPTYQTKLEPSLGSYELYGLRCVTFIECFT